MRKHNIVSLALVVLFLFETTVFHWLIPLGWHENITISPRFVFAVILFVVLFANRHFALFLGLMFGLLHDLVFYGFMIGPYAFGMGLTVYVIGLLFNKSSLNFLTTISVMMLGMLSFEMIVYGSYRLFQIIDYTLGWIFVHHTLPSLLINLLFVLMVYIPMRFLLEKFDGNMNERDEVI